MFSAPGTALGLSSLGALAVILGALYAAAALARRLHGTFWRPRSTASAAITITAARALGASNTLLIVEAAGQRFLIATGRTGTTAIGRLDGHG